MDSKKTTLEPCPDVLVAVKLMTNRSVQVQSLSLPVMITSIVGKLNVGPREGGSYF